MGERRCWPPVAARQPPIAVCSGVHTAGRMQRRRMGIGQAGPGPVAQPCRTSLKQRVALGL